MQAHSCWEPTPSCCEATVLTIKPPCCPSSETKKDILSELDSRHCKWVFVSESNITPVHRVIAVGDQAHGCCVICKLYDGVCCRDRLPAGRDKGVEDRAQTQP